MVIGSINNTFSPFKRSIVYAPLNFCLSKVNWWRSRISSTTSKPILCLVNSKRLPMLPRPTMHFIIVTSTINIMYLHKFSNAIAVFILK